MKCAIAVLIAALLPTIGHADDPLEGGDLTKKLAGPAIAPGSLVGKVVLLEYFGVH